MLLMPKKGRTTRAIAAARPTTIAVYVARSRDMKARMALRNMRPPSIGNPGRRLKSPSMKFMIPKYESTESSQRLSISTPEP